MLLIETWHLDAGPVTALAPTVSGIEGEQTRVELGETPAAGGTGALGGEHRSRRGLRSQHVHQPLAEIERAGESCAQGGLAAHADVDFRHRQLDGVLAEARQARPRRRRQRLAIDTQCLEALPGCPLGQIGVVALARHDERRQQRDALAAVIAYQAGADRGRALRLDRPIAVRAVLRAELHVQQPQEVIDLGEGRHGALAAAAAGALLDGDRGRDAEDRVHVGARRRLHELARVGVERFQVAALALVEENVEGKRRLARAGHAGDHGEAVARDLDVDVLEVVLARLVNDHRVAVAAVTAAVVRARLGDRGRGAGLRRHRQRLPVGAQRLAGERARVRA